MTPSPDAVDQSEVILSDPAPVGPKSYSCLRCGHSWTPKDQSRPPRCCSLCRSAYWDSPAAGEMTDEDRAAAQARVREKVAQRAALARWKTAERKLVRWAQEVGPGALGIVMELFGPKFEKEDLQILANGLPVEGWRRDGMPPPPKFEDEE